MAATVREIMNRELFSVPPSATAEATLGGLLALGITAAPVTDGGGHPLGVVSLRDLAGPAAGATVGERMSSPAAVVLAGSTIAEAGRLLAETGHRHLVVVDEGGRAAGMLSAIDVVRGLLGLPVPHPVAFPHLEARTGLQWTDDAEMDAEGVNAAPEGPGVVALVYSRPGVPDAVVWAEQARDVRMRLLDMLQLPQESPELRRLLATPRPRLRFRVGLTADPAAADRVATGLRDAARHLPPPAA
jgi:CBS domain-containing protein